MHWLLLIVSFPYLYLLLDIYRSLTKIKPYLPHALSEQFVSVIIACRNETNNLPFLLEDISRQNYNNENFEVIIIDDHSTDETFKIASSFKNIRNLKVICNSDSGKKKAIRTGIYASSGNLIITTDADCRIGERWISTIASFYTENIPDLILCPVRLESGTGFFRRFQELEYLSLQGITAGTAVGGNPVMCNGANMAFKKELYFQHSGDLHDEIASGDDVFLLHSIKKESGKRILWLESNDALIITKSCKTFGSFINQRERWISKAGVYNDYLTRSLAIVTFATILLQLSLLVAGIINPVFLQVLLVSLLLKSVPDYLILRNMAARYKEKKLLNIFLPGQIIYPFYVFSVFLIYCVQRKRVYSNYPSQTGT